MELLVHIKGASPEELQHGRQAAQAVFDAAAVTPWEAAAANFKMTGESEALSEAEGRAAYAWDEAAVAAAKASCADWEVIPESADLELKRPGVGVPPLAE